MSSRSYNTRAKLGYSDGERAALIVQHGEGKRLTCNVIVMITTSVRPEV